MNYPANSTEHLGDVSTNVPIIDIYDSERGIALWWLDLTFAVLFVLSIGQAIIGNSAILVLLVRYKPYIR